MLKRTYGHVPVLPSQHIVHPAAEDDFVMSGKAFLKTYINFLREQPQCGGVFF